MDAATPHTKAVLYIVERAMLSVELGSFVAEGEGELDELDEGVAVEEFGEVVDVSDGEGASRSWNRSSGVVLVYLEVGKTLVD